MNKFGIPDSVINSVAAVLEAGNKMPRQLKDPKKETMMGFQYKPGKVRNQVVDKKDVKDKEKKGYIHTEDSGEPTHIVTYTKGTKVGARSHRSVYVTADDEGHAEKVAKKHPDHPGKGYRVSNVHTFSESVDEDDIAEAMEMHLKPHGTAGTHYTVHKVGKKLAAHGGIKVGDKLSDTHVDDARDSGVKVRHVKEDNEVNELSTRTLANYHLKSQGDSLKTNKKYDKKAGTKDEDPYVDFLHGKKDAHKQTKRFEGGERAEKKLKKKANYADPVKNPSSVGRSGAFDASVHHGMKKSQMNSFDPEGNPIDEGGMGRIATDIRLGNKPGTGLKGFKKKSGDKYISKADAKLPKELAGGDTDAWKLGKSKPQKEEVEIDEKLTDDQKTLVKKALNIGGDRSKQLNKTSAPVKAAIYLAKMQKTRPGRPAAGPAGWQVKKDVTEKKHLDPVDHKDLKGSHADRKDKDIDNDGEVDDTDTYLHNRRKTVKKAMKEAEEMKVKKTDEPDHLGGPKLDASKGSPTVNEGVGDEKVRSSAQAAQLAKHYYAKAKQAQASGSDEEAARMMSAAKTFYRKSEADQAQEKGGKQVAKAESTENIGIGEYYFNELEIEEIEGAEDIVTEVLKSGKYAGNRKSDGSMPGESARSGFRVTKTEKEGPEHIVMQARKVVSLGKNHSGVEFKDGSKAKVDPKHAHAALNRYNQAKPTEKEHMQNTMNHSHAGFKHVASGKPMDHPDNPHKPQTRKLAGADRRTDRAVGLMHHPDD